MNDCSFDDNSPELFSDNVSVGKSLNGYTVTELFFFFTDSDGNSLHFIICQTNIKEEINLKELIEDRAGIVSFSLEDFGPHSVVLIEDNAQIWTHSKDVFNLSYIDACIKEKRIIDISPFLHCKSSDLVPDFPYMDIVYNKKFSWFNIPEKYKLATNSNHDECKNFVPFKYLSGNDEADSQNKCQDPKQETATNSNSDESMNLGPFKCLSGNDEADSQNKCQDPDQEIATNSNSDESMNLGPFKCLSGNDEADSQNKCQDLKQEIAINSNRDESMNLGPFKCLSGNDETDSQNKCQDLKQAIAINSNSDESMNLAPFKCLSGNEADSQNKFQDHEQEIATNSNSDESMNLAPFQCLSGNDEADSQNKCQDPEQEIAINSNSDESLNSAPFKCLSGNEADSQSKFQDHEQEIATNSNSDESMNLAPFKCLSGNDEADSQNKFQDHKHKIVTNANSDEIMNLTPFKCLSGNDEADSQNKCQDPEQEIATNSNSDESMNLAPFQCLSGNDEADSQNKCQDPEQEIAINSNSDESMNLGPFKRLSGNDEADSQNKCQDHNQKIATNSEIDECVNLGSFKCLSGNVDADCQNKCTTTQQLKSISQMKFWKTKRATNSDSDECMDLVPFKYLNGNDEADCRNKCTNPEQLKTISRTKFGKSKRTRMKYSTKEKEVILKYIVENDLYEHIKGNAMWKEMEKANICPIRTWQSMRAYAMKTLSNELHKHKFLSSKDQKLLRMALATNSYREECTNLVPFKCLNGNDEAVSRNNCPDPEQLITISSTEFEKTKRTRMPYSTEEKEAILKYIVENNLYEHIKGNSIWKEMEEANICPIRTWQSMREHALKTLCLELHKYKFLTSEDKNLLRLSATNSDSDECMNLVPFKYLNGNDEADCRNKCTNPEQLKTISRTKFGKSKRTRMKYSTKENEAILKYIVENDLYDHVKGVSIWKKMEKANICPIRTWQSMKEHARKSLSKKLHKYKFLTFDDNLSL